MNPLVLEKLDRSFLEQLYADAVRTMGELDEEVLRLRAALSDLRHLEHYHDFDHSPCAACSVIDRALAERERSAA